MRFNIVHMKRQVAWLGSHQRQVVFLFCKKPLEACNFHYLIGASLSPYPCALNRDLQYLNMVWGRLYTSCVYFRMVLVRTVEYVQVDTVSPSFGRRYTKRSLMPWVVVIPKEGRARLPSPALLLVQHRLFRFFFFARLSFGMTMTQDIRDLFAWRCPIFILTHKHFCKQTYTLSCINYVYTYFTPPSMDGTSLNISKTLNTHPENPETVPYPF